MHGNTLYISGTQVTSAQDLLDDIGLPFRGAGMSQRYQDAAQVLDEHPEITRVVGHSLGAAVAERLAADRGLEKELYAAPRFSWQHDEHAHKYWGDPISFFDFGASSTWSPTVNPHSMF